METNILKALCNLAKYRNNDLKSIYKGGNRANAMGDALEYYAKDLFCDSFKEGNIENKDKIHSQYFSYIGNQNNPPDFIIKQADAIEVKKLEGFGTSLALNSSYPKAKLHADSPMITTHCRSCEKWSQKDIIYLVGVVIGGKVKSIWFVYGDCYAADREVYERVRNAIVAGVKEIRGVELSETNELGRVNKVDPLGITYLRVRGMWGIESPMKAFDYLTKDYEADNLVAYAVMKADKYNSFPKEDRDRIESLKNKVLSIKDVEVKNPNNPAKYIPAKLFRVLF
ncbi:MAG: NgoPII family restriction endonuclease [Candidatus Omnitrophica bacterium]|nr:NgoPII family restriction endonuclease [Candidatus Omnitrophota bacterium]